jgi:hypothetical protein
LRLKLNSKVQQPRFHLPAGEIAEIAPAPLFGNPPQALITQASARMTTHRSPTLNQFERREFATPLLATHKPSTTQAIGQKAEPCCGWINYRRLQRKRQASQRSLPSKFSLGSCRPANNLSPFGVGYRSPNSAANRLGCEHRS